MKLTCIMCPVGCNLNITKREEKISVKGNRCPKGEEFGKQEVVCPKRIITTVKSCDFGTISLKSNFAVEKEKIDLVLKKIAKTNVPSKIKIGDTFIKNILKTHADIVITGINKIDT